jgi:hypothetical protein
LYVTPARPLHRPPDLLSRSPMDGYLSDYSSDQSMREQSESLSFYENNLERHKGGSLNCFLFMICVVIIFNEAENWVFLNLFCGSFARWFLKDWSRWCVFKRKSCMVYSFKNYALIAFLMSNDLCKIMNSLEELQSMFLKFVDLCSFV